MRDEENGSAKQLTRDRKSHRSMAGRSKIMRGTLRRKGLESHSDTVNCCRQATTPMNLREPPPGQRPTAW